MGSLALGTFGPTLIRMDVYIRLRAQRSLSSSLLLSLALDSCYIGYQFIESACSPPAILLYIDRATTLSKARPHSSSCEGTQIYQPDQNSDPGPRYSSQAPEPD